MSAPAAPAPRTAREGTPSALPLVALALALGAWTGTAAAGDPAAGREKSATCAACHGEAGIATAGQWPNLAGQYEDYLVHSLEAYRSGARQNAVMQGFAAQLSDRDIEDLAAYFSAQTGTLVTAPRDEVEAD